MLPLPLFCPQTSKRYLAEKPTSIDLLTDPAQWQELEAVKVAMLLADRETASLGDPFSQELLKVRERSITGEYLAFSSLRAEYPGLQLDVRPYPDLQRVTRIA